MIKSLLFLFFFVLLTADLLGFNLSLAPGLSVKNMFLYLIVLAIAVDAALSRNRRVEIPSVTLPYALLIFYAFFTYLVSVLMIQYPQYDTIWPLMALKSKLGDGFLILLVFFYGVLSSKDALWLMKMMIWTVVVINIVTVIDTLNVPDLGLVEESETGRVGGPIGEANQYAVFLCMFLPSAVALSIVETRWRRAIAIVGVAASGLALLMTVSRGGLVGLFAGVALGVIFLRALLPLRAIAMTAIGAVSASIFLIFIVYVVGYGELLWDRLIGQSIGTGGFEVTSGRTFIWSTALGRMGETPITLFTGFGWDTYRHFDFGFAPHSHYLHIYFELGVIGLLLSLFVFANILRISRNGLERAEFESFTLRVAFIFGLVAVLVCLLFVDLFTPWPFIWAFTGIALRLALSTSGASEHCNQGAQSRELHHPLIAEPRSERVSG